MSMKTLMDRRLLVLWLGIGFIGATLLLSELGCGQAAMNVGGNPQAFMTKADYQDSHALVVSDLDVANGVSIQGVLVPGRAGLLAGITPSGILTPDLTTPASGSPAPKAPQAPTVWKRDRCRPSFARVYVGDGNSLELVSLHVSVVIDGPRACTTVDHIFRNPHDKQLEGTFEYPLPTGASPSYFAMFTGQSRDTPPPRKVRASRVASWTTGSLAGSLPSAW